MKSILDKSFSYIPAAQTDLKKTFARIRKEQQRIQQERENKVAAIPQRRKQA